MKRILIIEDLKEVSTWLKSLVSRVFPDAVIDETTDYASSVEWLRRTASDSLPDLALFDLGLPDGDGTDLIRLLKRRQPEATCIVTTIFDDATHLFPALRAGADGYLLKDDDEEEFVSALRGIVHGRPPLSASVAQMMLKQFQPAAVDVSLTSREEDMLVLIANGYSVRLAAESLGITANTASGYLKNLYQKLHVTNRAEATIKAVNMGLVFPAERH